MDTQDRFAKLNEELAKIARLNLMTTPVRPVPVSSRVGGLRKFYEQIDRMQNDPRNA